MSLRSLLYDQLIELKVKGSKRMAREAIQYKCEKARINLNEEISSLTKIFSFKVSEHATK